ncbi:Transcription factor Nrm1/Whi5 [Moelleriella libera RCEF 2490]|uniref:Transcription factor Nrm1/Whi5 n=1 Tax=Moelleriella libera RCEF 2490 TaxID=1081109 RepID=A0A166URA4_9HYPO|nr:Transcription factor Nrm1/Whi5 [Moelleriella libera RCEF 2490]
MNKSSPAKQQLQQKQQRAPLTPLDANAKPSLPSPRMLKEGPMSVIPTTGGVSPLKRPLHTDIATDTSNATVSPSPSLKRACLIQQAFASTSPPSTLAQQQQQQQRQEQQQQEEEEAEEEEQKQQQQQQQSERSRTSSPDAPSIFDSSAGCCDGDSSWATTATEPDHVAIVAGAPALLAPRPRGSSLTREQAREKASILRLRLGLASYKVRTGQTTVPLAQLQHKPFLPALSATPQDSSSETIDAPSTSNSIGAAAAPSEEEGPSSQET